MGYGEKLSKHYEEVPYREDTIRTLGHWCRVGRVSEETVLDFLTLIEDDRRQTDKDMLQAESDYDRVFYLKDPDEPVYDSVRVIE